MTPQSKIGNPKSRIASPLLSPDSCLLTPDCSPPSSRSSSHRREAAFTLIEILVVIVIISILVGIVLGTAKYAQGKAARSRAASEIAAMETALENYKNDNGVYPTTPNGRPTSALALPYGNSPVLYSALVAGAPNNHKTYFTFKPNQIRAINNTTTNIVDPFGMPYNYYCTQTAAIPAQNDQTNSVTFDLWSYGLDNQNGTADDIVNWRQ